MNNTSFDLIFRYMPLLLKGALLSLQIFAISAAFSLALGAIGGSLTCRQLRSPRLGFILEVITFVLRAVPVYVQLLIAYFVLPDLLSLELDAYSAAIIALSLCSAGYTAQIVRGGLNSIPIEQWEAAFSLGYSSRHSLRYIIFPQVLRAILPAITGELDTLLKSTALLASIGLLELTRMGMNIVSREMNPLPIYLAVALLYIAISATINILSKGLERRLKVCS